MNDFAGKVALVTGAGRGIGRAIALGLAHRRAAVAVLDLDEASATETASAIDKSGGTAFSARLDIADEESVETAVGRTVTTFGRLDVAVNNAAVPSTGQELIEMTATAWERVIAVNLTGTFFSMKHEIPHLVRAGGGAIVNVASNGGLYAIPHAPAYVASKHGVVGLTKTAAIDYASRHVRINAVAPAITRTAMFDQVAVGTDMASQQETATPLGRLARPEEIAEATIWLASDQSSYVTGVVLSVDGGRRA
ncbi:SDR family NAD(P)-dependent oxidoreductase [Saccharopolyspora sp. 6M]|uniref:SDR family NAD(P)-dependent oxidoreductase n=1 Tax=Saccharopolyspora sp. 6M TaxID=2877237 RepID=UPI001CD206CE|nr:SDR family NAD(P)-dependent oxidoreductase [Saccharopolyspora sp. 6M]MCA1229715.1 SDR family oxidoreductase [Saccharopolyspora sp. 6M]